MKCKNKKHRFINKMCVFILTAVMLAVSAGVGFASDTHSSTVQKTGNIKHFNKGGTYSVIRDKGAEKRPFYRKINAATLDFHIEKNIAKSTVTINARSLKYMDHASVIVQFVNKNTGKSSVYSGKMKKRGLKFVYSKKHKLSKKGAYYVRANIRCYKDDRLVETIDKVSAVKRYKK